MSRQAEKSEGYNGWTNYETWAFALWWDNDRGLYEEREEQALGFWKAAESERLYSCDRSQTARINLAEWIKDSWVEENCPDLGASLWADLLGAAMSEIDYHEVADNWLSEVEGYERRAA